MYASNECGRGIKRPALVVYVVMPEDAVGLTQHGCVQGGYFPGSLRDESGIDVVKPLWVVVWQRFE